MKSDIKELLTNPGLPTTFKFGNAKLGDVIFALYGVTLVLVAFLAFFWLIWGAYQYILARGDKEGLARARARITWAIIGLFFVILAYFITQFAGDVFTPRGGIPFPSSAPLKTP